MVKVNMIVLIIPCGLFCFVQQCDGYCDAHYWRHECHHNRHCVASGKPWCIYGKDFYCSCHECISDSECSTGQRCDNISNDCVLTDESIAAAVLVPIVIIIISVSCCCYRKKRKRKRKREQEQERERYLEISNDLLQRRNRRLQHERERSWREGERLRQRDEVIQNILNREQHDRGRQEQTQSVEEEEEQLPNNTIAHHDIGSTNVWFVNRNREGMTNDGYDDPGLHHSGRLSDPLPPGGDLSGLSDEPPMYRTLFPEGFTRESHSTVDPSAPPSYYTCLL